MPGSRPRRVRSPVPDPHKAETRLCVAPGAVLCPGGRRSIAPAAVRLPPSKPASTSSSASSAPGILRSASWAAIRSLRASGLTRRRRCCGRSRLAGGVRHRRAEGIPSRRPAVAPTREAGGPLAGRAKEAKASDAAFPSRTGPPGAPSAFRGSGRWPRCRATGAPARSDPRPRRSPGCGRSSCGGSLALVELKPLLPRIFQHHDQRVALAPWQPELREVHLRLVTGSVSNRSTDSTGGRGRTSRT